MRHDYSNGADYVAIISIEDDEYVFAASDEEGIADFLCDLIGERECESSGVPVYIEASGWCPLAGVGEIYEDEAFSILIKIIQIVNNIIFKICE